MFLVLPYWPMKSPRCWEVPALSVMRGFRLFLFYGLALVMGLLWSAEAGYSLGLTVLLLACLVGVAALWWAQARALRQRRQ